MSTLCTMILSLVVLSQVQEPAKHATADLNGDGKPESISLEIVPNTYDSEFILTIDGKTIRSDFWENPMGLQVVDVDKKDRFKEVQIQFAGPSDDWASQFFRYDGKQILSVGKVPGSCTIPGDRRVLAKCWGGFYDYLELYRADPKTGQIQLVPVEMHYVGIGCNVAKPVNLYADKSTKTVLCTVYPPQRVVIESMSIIGKGDQARTWYLLRTPEKLMGWLPEDKIYGNFDGLHFAG